jgi:hypothetical protein
MKRVVGSRACGEVVVVYCHHREPRDFAFEMDFTRVKGL